MFTRLFQVSCLAVFVSLATFAASAQEVVHALTGTVTSIDPATGTITLKTDDGSEGLFKDLTSSGAPIQFSQLIRAETTPADSFKSKGDRVILFFDGMGDVRTAVALKDLGAGPFVESKGQVIEFNKSRHLIAIRNSSGQTETFLVGAGTVAESAFGAVQGERIEFSKGDQVRVTAAQSQGDKTARFIALAY